MYNSCGPFEAFWTETRNWICLQSVQLIPHPPCPFSFSFCEVLQRHLIRRSHPELSFYLGFAYVQQTTSITCIVLSSMTNQLKTLMSLAYVEQMAHTLFIVPCNCRYETTANVCTRSDHCYKISPCIKCHTLLWSLKTGPRVLYEDAWPLYHW
jgi:hypothetical protein